MASRHTRSNQSPRLELEDESDSGDSSERTTLDTSSSTETVISIDDSSENTGIQAGMSRDQLAFKLYKYEDRITRYESHKEFLSRCVKEKVIPRGLKVEVEPTIGNHDEEFVSLWNEKLKSFSLELMKDIITFCEKILTSTTAEKHKVDSSLKKETEILEYRTIKHTINKNVEATRNNCQKRKAKNFPT